MKLVVATFNRGKLAELAALLDRPGLELVSLADVPGTRPVDETGSTLTENALLKARAALARTGLPAIGDDTGLEVDALDGAPGVHSARWAGPGATDRDNVRKLLEAMSGVGPERRTARFRTVCAASFPDGRTVTAEGVLEGRIVERPRGTGGFGYDSVFEIPSLGRTLAELSADEKNARSHRAQAVRELAARLDRAAPKPSGL